MGGNDVEAVKGSSIRERKRVKCTAALREKSKPGGGSCLESDRFRFRFRVWFFLCFSSIYKIAPSCVCCRD